MLKLQKKLTHQNITQPDPKGYQVRVVRQNKEYSRYFAFLKLGGEQAALKAANKWREQIKSNFPYNDKKRKNAASKNNRSTGVLGVCKTISDDKRKCHKYLVYGVRWQDKHGANHCKTFRACNLKKYSKTMDQKAFAAAITFRQAWEYHCDNNTLGLFDPDYFLNWREMSYEQL